MPRSSFPLGLLVLLGLAAWLFLSGDSKRPTQPSDPDAPLAYEAQAPKASATRNGRTGAPTLQVDPAAQAHAAEAAKERAGGAADAPTGPYALTVIREETEMPLEDVALFEKDAQEPFGKTDENGAWSAEDMGVPELTFRAIEDGYLEHHGTLRPGERQEVVLYAGVPVSGHVLEAGTRRPIAGAQVRVWDVDLDTEIAATRSDEEGRFRLHAVRPHHPLYVVTTAPGLVPHVETSIFAEAELDHEILVGEGGRIEGHVTDEHGVPLAKAEVRLVAAGHLLFEQRPDQVASEAAAPEHGLVEVEQARTAITHADAKGTYAFKGVSLGTNVQCVAVFTPRLLARSKTVRLDARRNEAQVDLAAPPAGTVQIRVEEGAGLTLGHTTLRITLDGAVLAPMASDHWRDGAFVLEGLGPGRVAVRAELPGRPPASTRGTLRAGGTLDLPLRMPLGGEVLGEVRDKRGQPVWQVLVTWRGSDHREWAQVRTDMRGRFSFQGLQAEDGTLTFQAFDLPHTRQAYETRELEFIKPGEGRQVVTLEDGTTITGRFTELPENAAVTIARVGGVPQEAGQLPLDKEGRFRWRGPPVGSKALTWVFRTHGLPPLIVSELAPFQSEEVRDLGRLAFVDANPRRGQIVDERGRPVHAAKVTIAEPWADRSTRTDTKGEFGFGRVPDQPLKLRIVAAGRPPVTAVLDTRSQYVRQVIHLRAGRWMTLTLVDERGRPMPEARVRLTEKGMGARAAVHGSDTAHWLRAQGAGKIHTYLPLGTYQAFALGRGAVGGAAFTVSYKGDSTVTVMLRRRK